MLPGAVLAGALAGASPALAMGDGLSPGLFPLSSATDRVFLACDTDAAGDLNGCNAAGVEYLASPHGHPELFWNNGQIIEPGVIVQGMQEVGIVGKENAAASFDEVCVTADVTGGTPRDRGKLICVDIVPDTVCTDGSCSSSSCNAAVPVVPDTEGLCDAVEQQLELGYVINGLGYVIDIISPRAGESRSTTIRKCAGFAHRCTPVRDDVVVKGSRQTAHVETPHYTGGYVTCKTC
jgi:hypothetical protein